VTPWAAWKARRAEKDRLIAAMADVIRASYEYEGRPVPPALDDGGQRQAGDAEVRYITPRGPRHSKHSRRRGA